MTTSAITTTDTAALVAELGGSSDTTVDYMFGIGNVKDSDAVYFQYLGDDQLQALVTASGRPQTRIGNVFLTGVTIADDVYKEAGFSGDKLNVFLQTQSGASIMLTAGLTTIWSQCIMTALMGLADNAAMSHLLTIDTWKGTSKMKPCFAAVRDGQVKLTNDYLYEALREARSDRNKELQTKLMRDAVAAVSAALGSDVQEVLVSDVTVDNEF
tara:strand:- start:123 stop:761 length:639 start_codon:yes stop_codon:yes gene_type:complete